MKAAIVGFGVVGSGVAEILRDNAAAIEARCGFPLTLGAIVDLRKPAGEWEQYWQQDFTKVLDDPEIGVVVEAIGGLHPAYDFSMAAICANRHVVTSNKELVATCGAELLAAAKAHGVNYFFEASVGGGIPLLQPLCRLLGTEKITGITGILNGTTNFIMTRMNEDRLSFEDALALAQKNGYAEADPSADVEGRDACRKTAILASLLTKRHVSPDDVYTEGITRLTSQDTAAAAAHGFVIRLLCRIALHENEVSCQVTPALVPEKSPLGVTADVFNAALLHGEHLGDAMFYGRGAGKLPTANAVVSDMVEAVTANGHVPFFDFEKTPAAVSNAALEETVWMLRVPAEDAESAAELFGTQPGRSMGDEAVLFTMPLSAARLYALKTEAAARGVTLLSALRVAKL